MAVAPPADRGCARRAYSLFFGHRFTDHGNGLAAAQQMTATFVRTATAVLLGSASLLSQAATVKLTDWAYGDSWSHTVNVGKPDHKGPAGGFKGSVQFAASGESGFVGTLDQFITYCVEIEESFSFSDAGIADYEVVAGADYAKWSQVNANANANAAANGKTAAATADRLEQLLSYVASDAKLVDTVDESTSMQLAIWNLIYDHDETVSGGTFKEKSKSPRFNDYADQLMTASASWSQTLEVYVLKKAGSQDFLLTRKPSPGVTTTPAAVSQVPEPASLALAVLALGAAGAASRRRRV